MIHTSVNEYIDNRFTKYESNLRNKFVLFRELIHDMIRRGEAERLMTPLSVSWAITSKCNLNCEYCFANQISGELSYLQAMEVVERLVALNVLDISFEGGEPFLCDYFLDILQYAKDKDLIVDILSNGTLINDQIAEKIKAIVGEIDRIQISIGGNEEYNDVFRGKGSYQKVLKSLQLLQGLNVTINVVVTKNNLFSFKKLCEDLIKIHYSGVLHFNPVIPSGKADTNLIPDMMEAIDVFNTIKKEYDSDLNISGTMVLNQQILSYNPKLSANIIEKSAMGCCAARSKIYIKPDGFVVPCGFLNIPEFEGKYILDNDFWVNNNLNWKNLFQKSYMISKKIAQDREFIEFCPAINSSGWEVYEA